MSAGRILFIDAYDSFSNNIIGLLQQDLSATVESIRIDDQRFVLNDKAFYAFLHEFDAVVAGPGPGHPEIPQDVGLIDKLWSGPDSSILPVLGVCLGFQSLCLSQGAQICRLREPRHGIVTKITHRSTGMFRGARDVHATQYHSLKALLQPECVENGQDILWKPSKTCPSLVPLAWDLSDSKNGPILMAVEHVDKPFTAVQFHPESICTNEEGRRLIRNWWTQVQEWNTAKRRFRDPTSSSNGSLKHAPAKTCALGNSIAYRVVELAKDVKVVDIAELLHNEWCSAQLVLLESGTRGSLPVNPETGRFSVLGVYGKDAVQILYSCELQRLSVIAGKQTSVDRTSSVSEAIAFLQSYTDDRRVVDGPATVPFWGGLIGYISYEAGLETIDVTPPAPGADRPDLWFVYIERTVVIDHLTGTAFVQSIRDNDHRWLDRTIDLLKSMPNPNSSTRGNDHSCFDRTIDLLKSMHNPQPHATQRQSSLARPEIISAPDETDYRKKVQACQSHLRAGSSYELCLTAQTTIKTAESPWQIYNRLSSLNPAPFGAYLDFSNPLDSAIEIAIIGSSPERFLSWSRTGTCQFRPIKGTVSKAGGVTRAAAESILRTQKEVAENLMIVDLIRHDLAGVQGVQNVRVPVLMSVEEYETVYQLVSVIEGDLAENATGAAVLAASLPPGSMTGAPKRRSCELLRELEDRKPRGIYSGVVGYFDVGGAGDFSVVIRTASKWKDEDFWRVGAGGAVTMLSTPRGEWEEMMVKRERLVKVLVPDEVSQ